MARVRRQPESERGGRPHRGVKPRPKPGPGPDPSPLTLEPETIERLIAKFGPTIDLRAKPEVLSAILVEAFRAGGGILAASEHYKGDTYSKEMAPDKPPYEKNYTRGVARLNGLNDEQIGAVFDEVQLAIDSVLVSRLRDMDSAG